MTTTSNMYDLVFGCEIALGRRDRDGYVLRGRDRAHRLAWERVHGPVPDGMELDHVCRRRDCIALHHLELVTRSENEKRKSWRYRMCREACANGHELRTTAIVTPEGGRVCRSCNREANTGPVRWGSPAIDPGGG